MESRKPLSSLSDLELLSALETAPESSTIEPLDDLYLFLTTFNLTAGHNLVNVNAVYNLYKNWSKYPITKTNFFSKLQQLFPVTKLRQSKYLSINLDLIKINELIISKLPTDKIILDSQKNKIHFENFIKKFKLESGIIKNNIKNVYKLYMKWAKQIKKSDPLSLKFFSKFCRIYLQADNDEIVNLNIDLSIYEKKEKTR